MSTIERVRAKYNEARDNARRLAALNLQRAVGTDFYIAGWTRKAQQTFAEQWGGASSIGWGWPEIFRRHNDPDRLDMVVWTGNRLCGLGVSTTTGEAVVIRFIEREPQEDCPLKGRIALIMTECSALYAQARGRKELRIEPKNDKLSTLYKELYGFTDATGPQGRTYCVKRVDLGGSSHGAPVGETDEQAV
jgi:hypothetical protein